MKNMIMHKVGEDSWILWIKKRIKNNLNFVALLTGETGIGKSWNALSMAEKLDPDFDPIEQVAFKFSQLMKIVNKFNNGGEDDVKNLNKRKIKVCVFDEVQTDVSRRDWQKKANKFMLHLLSTFRHQKIIVLFTTPYEDYVDSACLKLFHANFECKGWSKKTKQSTVRPKLLQYNAKKRKFYEHSLYVIRGKKVHKLVNWDISCPSQHIIDPYEKSKFEFTNALNTKIYREMMEEEEKENEDRKPLTIMQRRVMIACSKYKTDKEIAAALDINSRSVVTRQRAAAMNKGYKIKEFEDYGIDD